MQNKKLNVLIYPMFSVNVINADSNYVIIRQLCNELIKTKKYNFFLILDSNRKYVKDNLNKLIKIIKIPLPTSKKHQVIHFNSNIFRQIYTKYAFDMIWNNVVEQGHHFAYFEDASEDAYRTKVFNYHHYVIHRSLPCKRSSYDLMRHVLLDQLIGSMEAKVNYFHSKHCFNMLNEEAQDILTTKQITNIQEKSIIQLGGYSKDIKSKKKYDLYTFIYNHRLDGYKQWKETFEVFDTLYDEGLKFQVILTAGDKDNIAVVNSKPYTIVKSFTLHEDYIKELSKCHANTINSVHETYCISIAESILNNQVVILPRRCTFPELVGKDYPYLFDSLKEQTSILRALITDNVCQYQNYNKSELRLSNHVKNIDTMFQQVCKPKYNNIFERINKEQSKTQIKKYLNKNNQTTLGEFKRTIQKLGYATQSFPNLKLKLILNEFNYDYNISLDTYIKTTN